MYKKAENRYVKVKFDENSSKNFSLKRINVAYFISVAFLCVILGFFITRLVIRFQEYYISSQQYFAVSKAALKLQEGSDYLTEEARLFIISTDTNHMNNYFNEINKTRRREEAIEELKKLNFDESIISSLRISLEKSYELEQKEFYAMKLMILGRHLEEVSSEKIPDEIMNIQLSEEDAALSDEYKIAKAWLIMFSKEYVEYKNVISIEKGKAIAAVFERIEGIHKKSIISLRELFWDIIVIVVLVFAFTGVFALCVNKLIIIPIYKMIKHIQNGEYLDDNYTKELDILSRTYNQILDKNEANEILLKHKAEHDELTGLMNRTAYNQIKSVLAGTDENITLILIDVDFFKIINDTYGHLVGDKVLQRVAVVLKESFRNTDYIARVGGDEFAVILTRCDSDKSKTENFLKFKMMKIKEELLSRNDDLPEITLSCGIDMNNNGYSEKLFEHADIALYEVKRAGRNNYKIYNDEMINTLVKNAK